MKRVALVLSASSLGTVLGLFACGEARAEPATPHPPRQERSVGVALDASGGVSNFGGWARGAHAVLAFSTGGANVGVAAGYTDEESSSNSLNARLWRAGAVVALGAPWDSHIVGCALEVGATVGETKGVLGPLGPVQGLSAPVQIASPYAQWSMVIQVPMEPVRPWVGVSASFVLDQLGEAVQTLSLTGGLAWTAW